jgi:hypothetical protein
LSPARSFTSLAAPAHSGPSNRGRCHAAISIVVDEAERCLPAGDHPGRAESMIVRAVREEAVATTSVRTPSADRLHRALSGTTADDAERRDCADLMFVPSERPSRLGKRLSLRLTSLSWSRGRRGVPSGTSATARGSGGRAVAPPDLPPANGLLSLVTWRNVPLRVIRLAGAFTGDSSRSRHCMEILRLSRKDGAFIRSFLPADRSPRKSESHPRNRRQVNLRRHGRARCVRHQPRLAARPSLEWRVLYPGTKATPRKSRQGYWSSPELAHGVLEHAQRELKPEQDERGALAGDRGERAQLTDGESPPPRARLSR